MTEAIAGASSTSTRSYYVFLKVVVQVVEYLHHNRNAQDSKSTYVYPSPNRFYIFNIEPT